MFQKPTTSNRKRNDVHIREDLANNYGTYSHLSNPKKSKQSPRASDQDFQMISKIISNCDTFTHRTSTTNNTQMHTPSKGKRAPTVGHFHGRQGSVNI